MKTSCCQRLRCFCCYCSKSSTDYTTQALRLTLYQASKAVCRAGVNRFRSIVCHNERLVAPIYEIADSEGPAIYLLPGGTYENVYCWQVGQSKVGEPGRVVATAHAALLQLWTLNAPGASICGHKTWRPRYSTYAKKIMAWHHLSAYLNWDPCKSMLTGIREMILLSFPGGKPWQAHSTCSALQYLHKPNFWTLMRWRMMAFPMRYWDLLKYHSTFQTIGVVSDSKATIAESHWHSSFSMMSKIFVCVYCFFVERSAALFWYIVNWLDLDDASTFGHSYIEHPWHVREALRGCCNATMLQAACNCCLQANRSRTCPSTDVSHLQSWAWAFPECLTTSCGEREKLTWSEPPLLTAKDTICGAAGACANAVGLSSIATIKLVTKAAFQPISNIAALNVGIVPDCLAVSLSIALAFLSCAHS